MATMKRRSEQVVVAKVEKFQRLFFEVVVRNEIFQVLPPLPFADLSFIIFILAIDFVSHLFNFFLLFVTLPCAALLLISFSLFYYSSSATRACDTW